MAESVKNKAFHKMAIQKNLVFLTSNTVDFFKLLITLHGKNVLSKLEMDEINSFKTDLEKNIELYKKIYKKDEDAFKKLCDALKETDNNGALSKLTNSSLLQLEESDDTDLLSGAKIPGSMLMKMYERRNIFRHFNYITESTMNLVEVLVYLEQVGVLTFDEHQKILSWRTDRCKNAALYLTLIKKKPNPFVKLIKVLRETNNGNIADRLETDPKDDENFENEITNIKMVISHMRINEEQFLVNTVPDNIWFGIRGSLSKDKFIGREDILEKLQKSIKSQEEEANKNHHSKFTVLCGLPGVGKSETARQYVHNYHHKDNVIWINAENAGSMTESFYQLAKDNLEIDILDIGGQQKDIRKIISEVYENLSDRRSIFIFDNAENKEEFRNENSIDKFLPILLPSHRHPYVIVTSQNKYWPSPTQTWDIIEIDVFTKMESAVFIEKRLQMENSEESKDDIENLSLAMKGHPLALTQAVEYISRENADGHNDGSTYEVSEFLRHFEQKEKEILDHNPFVRSAGSHNPHLITIFATWKLSIEGISKSEDSGEKAIDILNIIAYYDSYGISSKLFHSYMSDRRKLGMILGILKRYSLISCSDGIIDIHGLFQQVARLELQEKKREEEVLDVAMELLDRFMPQDSTSLLKGDEIAVPHALVAWDYAISYRKLVSKFHDDLGLIIVVNIGNGCYSKASQYSDQAIRHLSEEFGITNEQVMKMRAINVISDIRVDNNGSVATKVTSIMDVARDHVNRGILQPKDAVESIAFDYIRQWPTFSGSEKQLVNKTKETISKMTEEACKQKNDGEDDWTAVAFQLIQAALLEQGGRHDESLNLLKTAETAMETFLGTEHPLTLKTKTSIAGVLSNLGKTDEALNIMTEIRSAESSKNSSSKDGERFYNKPQSNADDSIFKLVTANVSANAGNSDEALKALGYEEKQNPCSSTNQKCSSNSKPKRFVDEDSLQVNVAIAKNLIVQGKYTEALNIAEENYHTSLNQFGTTNNATITSACVFIWALDRLERFDEALEMSQGLFDNLSSRFGDDHEITRSILLMIPELIEKRDKHRQNRTLSA